uniref:Uncharacterized protein n=1 Tax=Periophthalmus magnuspinnatus TaxID=409849 RepID=A0A3B4ANX6_9GOBI
EKNDLSTGEQFWAILETWLFTPSSPLAKTVRISKASLSISFSAKLLSASIMSRAWMISSHTLCRSDSFAESSIRRVNICCTRASVEFSCADL